MGINQMGDSHQKEPALASHNIVNISQYAGAYITGLLLYLLTRPGKNNTRF